jgi:hypothetical protein
MCSVAARAGRMLASAFPRVRARPAAAAAPASAHRRPVRWRRSGLHQKWKRGGSAKPCRRGATVSKSSARDQLASPTRVKMRGAHHRLVADDGASRPPGFSCSSSAAAPRPPSPTARSRRTAPRRQARAPPAAHHVAHAARSARRCGAGSRAPPCAPAPVAFQRDVTCWARCASSAAMKPEPVPISSTFSWRCTCSSCSSRASTRGSSMHGRRAARAAAPGCRRRPARVGRRHEVLAPHGGQQRQHGRVQHIPGADLLLDHVEAGACSMFMVIRAGYQRSESQDSRWLVPP